MQTGEFAKVSLSLLCRPSLGSSHAHSSQSSTEQTDDFYSELLCVVTPVSVTCLSRFFIFEKKMSEFLLKKTSELAELHIGSTHL